MAIKHYKPTTPGRRGMSVIDYKADITKTTPEKSLLTKLNKTGGRNNQGKITTRHKGGGVKQKYRIIDFKRNKDNIPAKVAGIEYDPNRSANIALLHYADGEKRYIIAPKGLTDGMEVLSGDKADIRVGHCLELRNMPDGTVVHNVELTPGKGGQIARSAGSSVQILGDDDTGRYKLIRLASGEVRKILANARATVGVVGNED